MSKFHFTFWKLWDNTKIFNPFAGTKTSSQFWNIVRNLIKAPSKELKHCQYPKPILLATGEVSFYCY